MNNRFSVNGDGRGHPLNEPRLTRPTNPSNDHEQQVIESLTKRYDEIEALWSEAEEDLKRFRVPNGVEHCYDSDYEGYPVHYILAWIRYGKGWRICRGVRTAYSEVDEQHPDKEEWKPIIECPLDVRLRMISEYDSLRRKVIDKAENAVPKLDEAIANFRKILKG